MLPAQFVRGRVETRSWSTFDTLFPPTPRGSPSAGAGPFLTGFRGNVRVLFAVRVSDPEGGEHEGGRGHRGSVQVDGSGPPYQSSMMCRAIETGGGSAISRALMAASSSSRLNQYASAISSRSTMMA